MDIYCSELSFGWLEEQIKVYYWHCNCMLSDCDYCKRFFKLLCNIVVYKYMLVNSKRKFDYIFVLLFLVVLRIYPQFRTKSMWGRMRCGSVMLALSDLISNPDSDM